MKFLRASDLIEEYGVRAFSTGLLGLLAVAFAAILFIFNFTMGAGLAWVLALAGTASVLYALWCIYKAKKVAGKSIKCVYCESIQVLLEDPTEDFRCTSCNRMIPVKEGAVLKVDQVRCGFCNALNYYSEKTEVLLCEECNREIPISTEDGMPTKRLPSGFAVVDDENQYELTLVSVEHKTSEELISALQHMLALNRNQVKQMLDELPVVLLRGIPRRKAEMLTAQLSIHDARADYSPIASSEA
jgi:LSD1 subclass zinc finger protein